MDNPLEQALERELAAFLQDEYAAQGEELYQWYRLKFVPHNIGLAPYDIAIANFVTRHCGSFSRFIEIGAGIGQQSMLLAARHRHTWAIEEHEARFAMAERAYARITQRVFTELPNYMTMICDWFPNGAADYVTPDSLLCFPTLSHTTTDEQDNQILDTMAKAGGVIFSLGHFFKSRHTQDEQRALIRKVRARGFGAPIDVHVWTEPELDFGPNRIVFMKKRRSLLSRLGISS